MSQYLVDTNGQVVVSTDSSAYLREMADITQQSRNVVAVGSLALKPHSTNRIVSIFTSKKKKNSDAYKLIVESRLQQLCSSD